jgi:hypothetical protein
MFWRDFTERVVRTFIATALAAVLAGMAGVTDWTSGKALAMSAITAGITAVITMAARFFGDPDSGSFWDDPKGK